MTRIRLILLSTLIFAFSLVPYAQQKPNSIYLELFGNGVIYSINYDRMFSENIGGRIGFMFLPKFDMVFYTLDNLLVIPLMFNYFVGSGNSKLELGAGIIYLSISGGSVFGFNSADSEDGVAGIGSIGYRYQNPKSGIIFRATYTPFFSAEAIEPSGGISFGICF